ncbi:hypothetical protein RU85_GL001524 [Lactococcus garvieae]|nr:hypothetical protein RU85_GL001524 [Lactococcus garvieae]
MPRHPPCALINFAIKTSISFFELFKRIRSFTEMFKTFLGLFIVIRYCYLVFNDQFLF